MDKAYHHPNLRSALIETGRRLIVRDGLAAFSLRTLAKELGVSHAAPYRHFDSKEALLQAIVDEDSRDFQARLAASGAGTDNPHERLSRLGEAYVAFFYERPDALALFNAFPGLLIAQGKALAESLQGLSPLPADYEANHGYRLLREAAGGFLGQHPGLSAQEFVFGLWAKVHGIATLLAVAPGYFGPDADIPAIVGRLIRNDI